MEAPRLRLRESIADAAAIAATHLLICVAARALGFDHISDDDFARVTIAESFAHFPKLNPSGTSWLPFPFWLLGSALAVFGRTLAVARAASLVFASLAAALPYLAVRASGGTRVTALVATAFAFVTPWAIWSGAATVPESITASLLAAGTIALTAEAPASLGALAIAAACLSRYETWPVAAVLAVCLALRRRWVLALVCAAAPLAWMAWNAHAHDGPFHFFRRVANYKRAIGEGTTSAGAALLFYPWLLLKTRPEVTVPALLLVRSAPRRWRVPLFAVAAQIAFLAYGNLRDGAPAHHSERALLGALVLLAFFVAQHIGSRRIVLACIGALWLASFVRDVVDVPGTTPSEDRRPQIARAAELPRDAHFTITPCAFEHFALIAAYGAPEAFLTLAPQATGADCPAITIEPPPASPASAVPSAASPP